LLLVISPLFSFHCASDLGRNAHWMVPPPTVPNVMIKPFSKTLSVLQKNDFFVVETSGSPDLSPTAAPFTFRNARLVGSSFDCPAPQLSWCFVFFFYVAIYGFFCPASPTTTSQSSTYLALSELCHGRGTLLPLPVLPFFFDTPLRLARGHTLLSSPIPASGYMGAFLPEPYTLTMLFSFAFSPPTDPDEHWSLTLLPFPAGFSYLPSRLLLSDSLNPPPHTDRLIGS